MINTAPQKYKSLIRLRYTPLANERELFKTNHQQMNSDIQKKIDALFCVDLLIYVLFHVRIMEHKSNGEKQKNTQLSTHNIICVICVICGQIYPVRSGYCYGSSHWTR